MSKFVSEDTFSAYVTDDFNWRLKEISDLRKAATSISGGYEVALRKAALALLYAHWEGYIKFVGDAYVKFVGVRKHRLASLVDEFSAVEIGGVLRKYSTTSGDLSSRLDFISDFFSSQNGRFRKFRDKGIATGGNLNFQRFSEICRLIKIDPATIVDKEFLDNRLLGVRNKVAHGESITVSETEFIAASDAVIEAMRGFRSATELCVIERRYLRSR